MDRLKRIAIILMPVWVFLFFSGLFLIVQFSGSQLSSPDDPSYHISHSLYYLNGEEWHYPVYSTLTTKPVDLWWLYHILLSKFLFLFDGNNYEALVWGVKVFHSLLAGVVFTIFYLLLHSIVSWDNKNGLLSRRQLGIYALIGTFYLFAASDIFVYRLFYYRPHVISIILVLLSFYFSLRGKYLYIFIVSFLAPFFYSASFLMLIPPATYLISAVFYNHNSSKPVQNYYPLIFSLTGLSLGIIARPDSINYLYNGYYLIILLLYNFVTGKLPEGGELAPLGALQNYFPVIIFLVMFFVYFVRAKELKSLKAAISFERFYNLLLCHMLFIMMIMVTRVVEYAIPIIIFFISWVIISSVMPFVKKIIAGELTYNGSSAAMKEIVEAGRVVIKAVFEPRSIFKRIFYFATAIYMVFIAAQMVGTLYQQPSIDVYKGASKYMEENSSKGDIVFIQRFDIYPRLVFFNTHNKYITGINNTYMYQYDPGLYWIWDHIIRGETVCDVKECDEGDRNDADYYEIIKQLFHAKYVFIDESKIIGGFDVENNQKFIDILNRDSRFKEVYKDADYPFVKVYEV